jgi:hypothetical protein
LSKRRNDTPADFYKTASSIRCVADRERIGIQQGKSDEIQLFPEIDKSAAKQNSSSRERQERIYPRQVAEVVKLVH